MFKMPVINGGAADKWDSLDKVEAGILYPLAGIKALAKHLSSPESNLTISYAQALQAIAVGIGYRSYEDALNQASGAKERHIKLATKLDIPLMLAKADELGGRKTLVNVRIKEPTHLIKVKNQIYNAICKVIDMWDISIDQTVFDDSYTILLHPSTSEGAMGDYTSKVENFYLSKSAKTEPEGLSNVDSRIYNVIHEINFTPDETLMSEYQGMELFLCASLPYCGHVLVLASATSASDKEDWEVNQYGYVAEISLGNVIKARVVDLTTLETLNSIVITEVGK